MIKTKAKSGKKSKKRLATIEDPTMEAIVGGMFRFSSESQALSLMQRLSQQFVIAKDQEKVQSGQCPSLTLWVRDFSLTEDEKAKGYKGNFARIHVQKVAEDKVTLVADKIEKSVQQHPQSVRPKRRHPNNGHPVIRAAQRNKIYPVIEQARLALLKMHEEFPETSIPGNDKLHLLLYSRQYKPPIHKVTVRIIAVPGEGYKFEMADNVRKADPEIPEVKQKETAAAPAEEEKMVDGKFTSLVAMQRKKRALKSKKAPVKPKESDK